jgi:hypothetical protein
MWYVSTLVVLTLLLLCELLLSSERGCTTCSLHQARPDLLVLFSWAEGVKLLKYTHVYVLSVGTVLFLG